MIKYVEYDSFDEYGEHIVPVNTLYQLNKTAASNYSPELMKTILSMKRREDRYYVVINAVGSHEAWGCNKNGDGFPVSGLSHMSYRTDMGTSNDYGFKTFEYYAVLFKHHVNKDPKKGFGEVVYSYWNPSLQRVELIVAINTSTGADIIEALENGDPVAVSMGCKVKYDRCSICDNKAKTRQQYCKHLKYHMKEIVTHDQAKQWSRETGKLIRPGMQVFAWNDYPRFFDISKVHIGADRTAFVLGKAANEGHVTHSVDIAEAYGVTDADFDKISQVTKRSEITKNIGGALGPKDIDGRVYKTDKSDVIRKALDAKMQRTIAAEPTIPRHVLDSMSALPLRNVFSTMLGMGIFPKPAEFQRIIIIKAGGRDIADELERRNEVFDHKYQGSPCSCHLSNNHFVDGLGKSLSPLLESRSCFTPLLKERLMDKEAAYSSTQGNDYWARDNNPNLLSKPMEIGDSAKILAGLGALYAGLKLKSMGYGPKDLANVFTNKPWLRTLLGGSVLWGIQEKMSKSNIDPSLLRPASDYEGILQDTNFSGHIKTSGLIDSILLPNSYIFNAVSQDAKPLSNGAIFEKTASTTQLNNSILDKSSIESLNKRILALDI